MIQLVLKKLKKSCTVAEIAEALEEPEEKIGRIVEIAQKYAPEYDERKILDEIMDTPQIKSLQDEETRCPVAVRGSSWRFIWAILGGWPFLHMHFLKYL